jgi:Ca-activated chloride channel family protein
VNTKKTETAAVELKLNVHPRRPALQAGFDNTVDILVQIEGPEAPAQLPQPTPINLALVLDRSGSMQGKPLAEAIRCTEFIIENLRDTDRAALVVYDNQVNVLVPNTELKHKKRFISALQTIVSGGNTDLHSGWLLGAQEAAGFVASNRVSRVMLLSDGQANTGITDLDAIANQCGQLAETGVSTSTCGLGYYFNEDLMVSMAKAGCGNSYYGETAEDLIEPFQREFDLLSCLCAKQVSLHIQPKPGIIFSVLNPYLNKGDYYTLPDVPYGGVAWAIIRLKIPAGCTGSGDGTLWSIADVMVSAKDINGHPLSISASNIQLPSLPTQAWQSIIEDESVCRRIGEVEAALIQDEARRAARNHDWGTVQRLLEEARIKAPDNPWVSAVLDTLEILAQQQDQIRFSKEAMYSSHSMGSRLSGLHEGAGFTPDMEENSMSYLRRKQAQGKSSISATQPPINKPKPNKIFRWFQAVTAAIGSWNSSKGQ